MEHDCHRWMLIYIVFRFDFIELREGIEHVFDWNP